ncbi:RtcB family protein [Aeromicrobium sp. 179-A 4D2 NHS]|uniref:RtcB family protein n=1 Tax=Aeromicrobium sp. 179-A 4D2 NHS TaxID=3142375 RepID=UPI0039A26E4B
MTSYEMPGAPNVAMWVPEHEIEAQAVQQIRDMARLPYIEGIRIMPDVHYGAGAVVGSVIAMKDALSPSAVGVDIGCGMAAVKTSVRLEDLPDDLGPMRAAMEKAIPVGYHGHDGAVRLGPKHRQVEMARDNLFGRFYDLRADVKDREGKAMNQCGSLGSGNHFCEVTASDDGDVWLTLHSGSRNIGKEIAERHINTAKSLEHNAPWGDMAVFLSGTAEMDAYRHDLYWAQEYAMTSRRIMLALFKDVFESFFDTVNYTDEVLCHHNYVAEETYDGVDLIVTRKGAIRAAKGDMGLIPGSMGTGSFIVRGLGNNESYQSASHGAGRKMSRGQAKRTFTVEDLAAQTAGVECRKDAGVVDEIPGAYKSIESVIEAQTDLVEVVARLHTLLCVKG